MLKLVQINGANDADHEVVAFTNGHARNEQAITGKLTVDELKRCRDAAYEALGQSTQNFDCVVSHDRLEEFETSRKQHKLALEAALNAH